MDAKTVTFTAIPDLPLVGPGDDLAAILIDAFERAGIVPQDRDVLVIAQKVVSKAEGRYVDLADIVPSPRARELAAAVDKDPRLVEVILSEAREVVRFRPGVLVVEHRLGFVMANAGVDQSNIEHPQGSERVLLLPEDPDAACAALKAQLDACFGVEIGVVINDSFGRPWRNGVVGVALGAAGLPALLDLVGAPDLFGRAMRVTEVAVADELAAAASLLMGQAGEGLPIVLVRGLSWDAPPRNAAALLRSKERDLFR
ncbi:coenzyme F420-0:L-glutamate ligase [Rhodospirillaceae bacterium SYSU D60014]|uniref:coenzyme F420-0:L-glutamate ligase n=1 Tax=Virgifigura deserti TaxID=2268457 RepID=UPI000E66BD13